MIFKSIVLISFGLLYPLLAQEHPCTSEVEEPSLAEIAEVLRAAARSGDQLRFNLEEVGEVVGMPAQLDFDGNDKLLGFLVIPQTGLPVAVNPEKIDRASFLTPTRPKVVEGAAKLSLPDFVRNARRSADTVTFTLKDGRAVSGKITSASYGFSNNNEVMETISVSTPNGGNTALEVSKIVDYVSG